MTERGLNTSTFFIQRLQTFFYFCHVFTFFNVFYFFLERFFTSMVLATFSYSRGTESGEGEGDISGFDSNRAHSLNIL